jgi:glycosyltransferase involved in cell wall biosynthesis
VSSRPPGRAGTLLRRVARRPRRWVARARAHPRTEAARAAGSHAYERVVLAWRGRRGRARRDAEWARTLERIAALPASTEPTRKIATVRVPDGSARAPFLPVGELAIGDAELICFLLDSAALVEPGSLARLAAAVDGTKVVAASPLVVHPLRPPTRATPDDGRVRARGLALAVEHDAPVLRANDAGAGPAELLGAEPLPVAGATGACLVVDRRAYAAAVDGRVPGPVDLDVATFDLCRRLAARGGTIVAVADAVVVDHREVSSRRALVEPIATTSAAWRAYVESHGAELMRAASPLPEGGLRIALTVAAPSAKVAPRWGDWHLAEALARALRRRGHAARVQTLDHADDLAGRSCDVHCVVRGLAPVRRTPGQVHVLWIISHPEDITAAECDDADLVLVASARFAEELRRRTRTPVEVMLQATDPSRFRPVGPDPLHAHDVAVVAKSRGVFRKTVKDAVDEGLRPAIYGSGWEAFVDPALVVSTHVDNDELPVVYSSVGVLLNDHWQTMREWGFASNRLFDALACETPVISDDLVEITELFDGTVLTYHDPHELRAHVDAVLADPIRALARAARGREIVTAQHTFDHRAAQLLDALRRHGLTPARREPTAD